LEANGTKSNKDEALEHALRQPRLGCCLAHNDRPELTVVTDEDDLLRPHGEWDQSLRLDGLGGLVNNDLAEAEILQAGIPCTHACAANDIGSLKDLTLGFVAERAVLLLIALRQLSNLIFEALELVELVPRRKRCHDVKAEMIHLTRAVNQQK
jgi:hypothetical protein